MLNSGRRRCAAEGFTLIELMVVLVILAVVLVWAAPSFLDMLQRNRIAAQVNALVGDLQFARAEAIRQGIPVTVCASSNGSSCLGSATWNTGWIVFADPNSNKTRDASDANERVLRSQSAWKSSDILTASNSIGAISYSRDGFAIGLPTSGNVVLTLHTSPVNASATRCVSINFLGHQQVLSANGSTCT